MPLQLKVLEEGLVNHPVVGFGETGRKTNELRILLAKIEESEVCNSRFGCLIYIIGLSMFFFGLGLNMLLITIIISNFIFVPISTF